MRYVPPKKLKVIMMAFFGTGIWGIAIGFAYEFFFVVVFGVINFAVGGIVGYFYLNPKSDTGKE